MFVDVAFSWVIPAQTLQIPLTVFFASRSYNSLWPLLTRRPPDLQAVLGNGTLGLEFGLLILPPLTLNLDGKKGSSQETKANLTLEGLSALFFKCPV